MPKGSQQTRGDIIIYLKENRNVRGRTDLITPAELELAMSKAGISAPGAARDYIKNLVDLNYLRRTGGGFKLARQSRESAVIRVTVSPTQNTSEVLRAVEKATQRFGGVVDLEVL
jgi:hypothetical protein